MIDAVTTHNRLYGGLSPLMFAFTLWVCLANPKELLSDEVRAMALKCGKIEDLSRMTRPEFFKKVLPFL